MNGYDMTGNLKNFREGATAYRNNRGVAMTYRPSFIKQANEKAHQMYISDSTTTISNSRASLSPLIVNSDTEDELARNEVTPVKRPRPAPVPPSRRKGTSSRSSHAAP